MVKKGGTKRNIDKMEKITKREYRATTFTKRSFGLHSKAAQLCLLADAQIAILATPPSSQSNVSFFSSGHSSVDAVVNAISRDNVLLLLFKKSRWKRTLLWWEKESLSKSKNRQELMDAIKAMERMLSKLRSGEFVSDEDLKSNEMAKSDVVSQRGTQDVDETLNDLQAVCCVPGDDLAAGFDKNITEEQDQILAICGSFCATDNNKNINGLSDEMDDLMMTCESSVFDSGVLDSTQELLETTGSLWMNFDNVSTNPGVEEEALVFQNKTANDISTKNPYPVYDFEDVLEEEAFVFHNRGLGEDNNLPVV
ncbi:hypothetical protein N665_0157s0137 [Sinapis alba]|nr:hypothetical protein N665_0157s0137 [Sinapis alba]